LKELGLSRSARQIYHFIWRRLGKTARIGAAAAVAAVAAATTSPDAHVANGEGLEHLPLMADLLGQAVWIPCSVELFSTCDVCL
jgi:hypothetical protein